MRCRAELFVTVTPTVLTPAEELQLDALRDRLSSAPFGDHLSRVQTTILDTLATLRTKVSVLQLMLLSADPLPDVAAGAIASALTAPYDVSAGQGFRVAAARRRLLGGFDLDPARHPEKGCSGFPVPVGECGEQVFDTAAQPTTNGVSA